MKKVFAFTMIFITLAAALLFWETVRMQFFKPKNFHGTFACVSDRLKGDVL